MSIFLGEAPFIGLFLELGILGEFFLLPEAPGDRFPEERRLLSPALFPLSDNLGLFPLCDKLVFGDCLFEVFLADKFPCFSPAAF